MHHESSGVVGPSMNPQAVVETARQELHYDQATGAFTWARDQLGGQGAVVRAAGSVAGCFDRHGYRVIRLGRKLYRAPRLAWLWMTGEWPALIDHINGNKGDDRWENLRIADKSLNALNVHSHARNACGLRGIRQSGNSFVAKIRVAGVTRHLGSFRSAEAAHTAYLEAKRALAPEAMR